LYHHDSAVGPVLGIGGQVGQRLHTVFSQIPALNSIVGGLSKASGLLSEPRRRRKYTKKL
jgi:hypothetical protein